MWRRWRKIRKTLIILLTRIPGYLAITRTYSGVMLGNMKRNMTKREIEIFSLLQSQIERQSKSGE